MNSERRWDQRDLLELMTLEPAGQHIWHSHVSDSNSNGRVYGGQLLAQTVWAAAQTAEGRSPSTLQMTFLQGAHPQEAIEYSVECLQDGRRLSTRHIYGVQGTGLVLSANASFQVAQTETDPGDPQRFLRPVPAPESLPRLSELAERDPPHAEAVQLRFNARPVLDIRPVRPEDYFERPAERREVMYWVRLNQPLPAEGCLHHAALAYLSDCWVNASLAPQQGMIELWQNCYVSSLNHTLWFHSPEIDVNQWLLFVNDAVHSVSGRGLTMTHIYQRSGQLVASMAQDVLISARAT